jgi:hypothetical protein
LQLQPEEVSPIGQDEHDTLETVLQNIDLNIADIQLLECYHIRVTLDDVNAHDQRLFLKKNITPATIVTSTTATKIIPTVVSRKGFSQVID